MWQRNVIKSTFPAHSITRFGWPVWFIDARNFEPVWTASQLFVSFGGEIRRISFWSNSLNELIGVLFTVGVESTIGKNEKFIEKRLTNNYRRWIDLPNKEWSFFDHWYRWTREVYFDWCLDNEFLVDCYVFSVVWSWFEDVDSNRLGLCECLPLQGEMFLRESQIIQLYCYVGKV